MTKTKFNIQPFIDIIKTESPRVFINKKNELIVIPAKNVYFRLEDIHSEFDLKVKILTWCSRAACKGVGPYWEIRMRKIINTYLNTSFEEEDFRLIYQTLGNDVNRPLCLNFINSNYDLSILEKYYINKYKHKPNIA